MKLAFAAFHASPVTRGGHLAILLALLVPSALLAEEPGFTWLTGFTSQVEGCFEQKSPPVCVETLRYRCARAVIEGKAPEGTFLKPDQCSSELLHQVQAIHARERLSRLAWAGDFAAIAGASGGRNALDLVVKSDAAWADYAQAECEALPIGYAGGTARYGYGEMCLLRLTVERIEHLRRFHPDGLTRDDFDKE